VLAQALDVTGLETRALDRRDHRSDLVQLAVGEHVPVDEAPPGEAGAPARRSADPVVEEPTLGPQQRVQAVEVRAELRQADVLEHADRGHRVVRAVTHVAVVLESDLHAVRETGLRDRLLGPLGLSPRDRHAHRVDAVVGRRVHRHPTPPAPDVEQAHPLAKPQLAADQLVLGLLRLFQRRVDARPDRAGVAHRGAEHEPVERVRDVVVVRDRGGVATLRVPATAEPNLLLRRRERPQMRGGRRREGR